MQYNKDSVSLNILLLIIVLYRRFIFPKVKVPLPLMQLTIGMCLGVTWPSSCHPGNEDWGIGENAVLLATVTPLSPLSASSLALLDCLSHGEGVKCRVSRWDSLGHYVMVFNGLY